MNESLTSSLRQLRLSGMAETLDLRLQEARAGRLTHQEFLELIMQDELLIRGQRKLDRQTKNASFRDMKTLDDFDWSFNPSINRKQIYELATGNFIKQKRDVLFCSAPGTGKSHLAQAIGYQAIKQGYMVRYRSIFDVVRDLLHDEAMDGHDRVMAGYLKPELLIIDDFGMKQLPKRSGEFLFEIIMRRHETRSTMMTTNRPVEDWGRLLGDVPTATAILDRFLHHADIINIKGRSYRINDRVRPNEAKAPPGSDTEQQNSKRAKAPPGSAADEQESQAQDQQVD